jgi:acetyltransferase EpsM
MGKPQLIIWGASGHALVAADIVRCAGQYDLLGFLDDLQPQRRGEPFGGSQVLGGQEELGRLRERGASHLFVGIGDCAVRQALAARAEAMGFVLARLIHPRSIVAAGVAIGPGSMVAAGAVVNPGVRVGRNVIINTGATVDHESSIEEGAHIGPGAHLGGRTAIGPGVLVGIGAIIRDRIKIGKGTAIGAGAVVVKDIPPLVLAYGVPARVVREIGLRSTVRSNGTD